MHALAGQPAPSPPQALPCALARGGAAPKAERAAKVAADVAMLVQEVAQLVHGGEGRGAGASLERCLEVLADSAVLALASDAVLSGRLPSSQAPAQGRPTAAVPPAPTRWLARCPRAGPPISPAPAPASPPPNRPAQEPAPAATARLRCAQPSVGGARRRRPAAPAGGGLRGELGAGCRALRPKFALKFACLSAPLPASHSRPCSCACAAPLCPATRAWRLRPPASSPASSAWLAARPSAKNCWQRPPHSPSTMPACSTARWVQSRWALHSQQLFFTATNPPLLHAVRPPLPQALAALHTLLLTARWQPSAPVAFGNRVVERLLRLEDRTKAAKAAVGAGGGASGGLKLRHLSDVVGAGCRPRDRLGSAALAYQCGRSCSHKHY